jgi:hypothetical protein
MDPLMFLPETTSLITSMITMLNVNFTSSNPNKRVLLFPRYCTPEIKDIVMLLPGYESRDWDLLQTELKRFYWQTNNPKNTLATLNSLIRKSARLPLNAYVLKFASITNVLDSKDILSPINHVARLLEGLDERMRKKVIKFCTLKNWKVASDQDDETPNFDEIKKFLEHEALTMERISVYERENPLPATLNYDAISAISQSSDTPAVTSPKPAINIAASPTTPNSIPIVPTAPASASAPAPAIATIPTSSSRLVLRVSRCIWCDSPDHSRRSDCALFAEALKTRNIRINEVGHVVLSSTAAEIPPAFGRGGMKSVYDVLYPQLPSHGLLRLYAYDDQISA